MARTAVVTVCHPGCLFYLRRLAQSLQQQTFRDFDWIISRTGVTEDQVSVQLGGQPAIQFEACSDAPYLNRPELFRLALELGYRYAIFQDGDDWMSQNRVEDATKMLQRAPFCCHELDLYSEEGHLLTRSIWAERLEAGPRDWSAFLLHQNIFGLGNTSVDLQACRSLPSLHQPITAVDWFIFYHLLQENSGVFSSSARVNYRQHLKNTVGISTLSAESLARTIAVKKQQYQLLSPAFPDATQALEEIHLFEEQVMGDPEVLQSYVQLHQSKQSHSFWWEETNYAIP